MRVRSFLVPSALLVVVAPALPGAAAPPAPGPEPACTAEAIGADAAMTVRPEVVCSAGFAMALLAPAEPSSSPADGATTTTVASDACERADTCPQAEIFHVTTSGWVHDGRHDRDCAEHLGVLFMSPQTAATFAPVCDDAAWPAPETVQRDDGNASVMYVQIALVARGYDVAVDGTFDAATESAVAAFQQANGLAANGIVGPETHALLGTGPNPPLPPTTTTTTTTTPAAPMTPGPPRACTVEAIAADTGLTVASIAECAGGWTLGLLTTTCPLHPEEPDVECEAGDLFHVTEDGWVHDGTVYPYCADYLAANEGISIHTALTWAPVCGGDPIPERTNIEPGSSGQRVAQLQIALVGLGYPIAIDGEYGPRTEAAVRDFQQRNALAVDGIAGPQTQESLAI